MKSLILTAGHGTRFQPYTDKLAKPAIEFLTLPMMMYSRYYAEVLQSEHIAYNLHHLPDTVKQANNHYPNNNIQCLYSDETQKLLDSGGGIKKALKSFYPDEDSVFVSNGDNICLIEDEELLKAQQEHQKGQCDVTIIVGKHPDAGTQLSALYADTNLSLKDKGLNRSQTWTPYHYLGMMFFNSKSLRHMPEGAFSLFDDGLLPNLKTLKVKLHVVNDYLWFETGNPHDYLNATAKCIEAISDSHSKYGKKLIKILKKYNPDLQLTFTDHSKVLSLSKLKDCSTEGFVAIGHNCSINNSRLKNCIVQSGTVINEQNLENTLVMS